MGQEDAGIPQARMEYSWVAPVLEEAKNVREEQGQVVLRYIRELVGDFGTRWGRREGEMLKGALRQAQTTE